jgi:hypothetical protein
MKHQKSESQREIPSLFSSYSEKNHCTGEPALHAAFAALYKGAIVFSEHNSHSKFMEIQVCSTLNLLRFSLR